MIWLLVVTSCIITTTGAFFFPGFSPLCKHQRTDGKITAIDWTWLTASIIPLSIMFHKPKHHSVNAFWTIKVRSVHGLNYRNNSQLHWSSCHCGCKKNCSVPSIIYRAAVSCAARNVFHLNLHPSWSISWLEFWWNPHFISWINCSMQILAGKIDKSLVFGSIL